MRTTTLIRTMLGVTGLILDRFRFTEEGLVVTVRPQWRKPRCGRCGKRAAGYDQRSARVWRHLGIGRLRIWLEYAPQRVKCQRCSGVFVEKVPWAPHKSRFTWDSEKFVAYLAQVSDKTKVTEQMGIAWPTVGAIVERVVGRQLDPSRLDGLRRIGVDDFSYRKRQRYLTTVVDHDQKRVVWAAAGRSAATLQAFFAELGPRNAARTSNV